MGLWTINFSLALLSFATFYWGVRAVFRKVSDKDPRGMILIKLVSGIAMVGFLITIALSHSAQTWILWLADALFVISNCLFWMAVKVNRKQPLSLAYSPDLPVHVVKTGVYSKVRHPFYTSYLVAYIASFLSAPTPISALLVTIMAMLYFQAARTEEKKFNHSNVSSDYRQYAHRTGMFFPKLTKKAQKM